MSESRENISKKNELLSALLSVDIFNGFIQKEIIGLTLKQKIETLQDGSDLFLKYKKTSSLAYVVSGAVEVMDTVDGFEYKGSIEPNNIVNLAVVLNNSDDKLEYISSGITKVLFFEFNAINEKKYPLLFLKLFQNIVEMTARKKSK
ncbi:MAG: hypothetical protein GQ570_06880 [Helicobacteraceae bacterium]|nr:hypothetical protein [Helicobacteraceae bacterium]